MTDGYIVARIAVSSAVYAIDKAYDYYVPEHLQEIAAIGMRVMVPFGNGNKKIEGIIVELATEIEKRRLKYISHIFNDDVVLEKWQLALAAWMKKRYYCTIFEGTNIQLPPGMWNKNPESYSAGKTALEDALAEIGSSKIKKSILEAIYGAEKPITEGELSKLFKGVKLSTHLNTLLKQELIIVSQKFNRKVGDKTILSVKLNLPLEQALIQVGSGKASAVRREVLNCIAQAGMLPEKELCYLTGAGSALIKGLEKRGIIAFEHTEVYRSVKLENGKKAPQIVLNTQQLAAFDELCGMMEQKKASGALLHGVTGCGKTSVYIRLIEKAVEQGKNAMLLVPEIALTPQTVRNFCMHFGDEIAVIHSGLAYTQRYDEYKRIKAGKVRVVIGTRSAVFAPISNLAVIIIDEEQENTYKSETAPRYHATEVAKYRCAQDNALLLLGSATPSVESYFDASCGKLRLINITERYGNTPLPHTIISDMRGAMESGDPSIIGKELRTELKQAYLSGKQSILFINRRGSARMITCVDCGYVPMCQNCATALVYHSKNDRLMCHHCGYSTPVPKICTSCGSEHLKQVGVGTQRVEEELKRLFPDIKVLRMDADTTTGRTTHEKLLERFEKGKADVLVGTQMVAKGLDFENVSLVGVLDADLSLFCGDYHGQERTFSLLTQVVGRAGRRSSTGRAVVQTYNPGHPIITAGAAQDYKGFYEYEIRCRRAIDASPYASMYVFSLSGINEIEAMQAALRVASTIRARLETDFKDINTEVLGPAAASIARVNKRYRFTVAFRGHDSKRERELTSAVLLAFHRAKENKTVSIAVELNPFSF